MPSQKLSKSLVTTSRESSCVIPLPSLQSDDPRPTANLTAAQVQPSNKLSINSTDQSTDGDDSDAEESPEASLPYKRCSADEKERHYRRAICSIHQSGCNKLGKPNYSVCQAARDFDVPNSTLQGRFAGRLAKKDAHEGQKHFSKSQEHVIADWISTCGKRGIPVTLQAFTSDFLGHPIGENWPCRFIKRHPELKVSHQSYII